MSDKKKQAASKINKNADKINELRSRLLSVTNSGVFAYTFPERELLIINEAALNIMECKEETFKADFEKFYAERVSPEDRKIIDKQVKNLKKPGDSIRYRYHIKRTDGSVRVVASGSSLLELNDGSKYILSSLQDITAESNLEVLLATERAQYRAALLENSEMSFSIDLTEGYLHEALHSNNKDITLEKLGLKLPVAYGDLIERWMRNKDLVPFAEGAADIMYRDALLQRFKNGESRIEAEYYGARYDEYYNIWILLSKMPEDGHVHGIFIAYNITAKIKEEQRHRKQLLETKENLDEVNKELKMALQSEKEKTEVISAMGAVYYKIYLLDLNDETLIRVSDMGYLDRNYIRHGEAQVALSKWLDSELQPAFKAEMNAFFDMSTLALRMQNTHILNHECHTKTAGWIRLSFIAVKRDSEGNVFQVLLAVQHIDEEKQLELSQQAALKEAYDVANKANAAKTKFLSTMSHDIRTPMNAIIGMSAIAGAHLDDKERVADCLNKIDVSSKHLLGLINEVLDMSKIESGKLDLYEEAFSLPELIDDMLAMVKPQVNDKNHELSVAVHNIEHEDVIGDSQRIQQSFMNLMSNAIKYTPDGGKIILSISEKPINKKKFSCYEFIFEDNGIGMSEEFQEHLFDPFTRATDSRVNKIQGTGLGMAITRNVVRMMNGDIKVESKLGVGTKITVTIMLKLQKEDINAGYAQFENLSVLVVDDDSIACETTCEVLKELGINGEGVLSGKEAVSRVIKRNKEKDDFFAVIVDWKMPKMDGVETTKAIRKAVGNKMPIIISSTYDWSDIEDEMKKAGVNAFVSKPLFKSRVAHLINELLGNIEEDVKATTLEEIINSDFSGKRALLVEDNELNSEIAGEILKMTGLEVDYAENGKEAVDIMSKAENGYYDIIFMDVQMPVMNGYDATVAIRALPGGYSKQIPIIAMTANAFTDDIRAAENAGMNQHMAKPLDFNELKKVLHKWL